MLNKSTITKFGIELGQVFISFRRLRAERPVTPGRMLERRPEGAAACLPLLPRTGAAPEPSRSLRMRPRLGPVPSPLSACWSPGARTQPVNVTYEGFECPDVPGLDDFLQAADANNDNRLNSDEFNSRVRRSRWTRSTPDGQLDRNELAAYVCAKNKAKAAAAAPHRNSHGSSPRASPHQREIEPVRQEPQQLHDRHETRREGDLEAAALQAARRSGRPPARR